MYKYTLVPLVQTGAHWCPLVQVPPVWHVPAVGHDCALLGGKVLHSSGMTRNVLGWSEGPAQHRRIHSFLPLCTSCQCVISESPMGIKVRWKSLLKLKMGKGLIDPCARNAVHDLYVHSRQTYAWTHVCTHIHAARTHTHTHTHTHTTISPATM